MCVCVYGCEFYLCFREGNPSLAQSYGVAGIANGGIVICGTKTQD